MKNKKLFLPIVITFIAVVAVTAFWFIKKNMPCKDYMSLAKYYGNNGNGYTVVLEDKINEEKALYQKGHVYIDYNLVSNTLNKRFYWDSNENLLIYTTATAVITTHINSNKYTINKSLNTKDYVIAKLKNNKLYIALDFVKDYTALYYNLYKNPNRVVLKYEYGKKQKHAYDNVVLLCNNILNNSHNLYNDILKRIYYYLCASHAHLGDEAFFELRDKLNEYEKVFLHGIYYRKRKRYDKAEAKFREALNIYPNSYTAKNELAIALQRQGRYLDALHIAKEAYNAQPNNAFYIVTYFKSLVRDIKTEEYVLKELIDRLRSAWDTNREIFSLMLEAEYEYYRNNDFNAAMTLFKRALEINNFQPIFISASEICSIENRFDVYEDLAKKYHYND